MEFPEIIGPNAASLVSGAEANSSGGNVLRGVSETFSSLTGWDLLEFSKTYGISNE